MIGSVGGGMVSVILIGVKECCKVCIDLLLISDLEMLEDLIVVVFNDVLNKIDVELKLKMGLVIVGM